MPHSTIFNEQMKPTKTPGHIEVGNKKSTKNYFITFQTPKYKIFMIYADSCLQNGVQQQKRTARRSSGKLRSRDVKRLIEANKHKQGSWALTWELCPDLKPLWSQ